MAVGTKKLATYRSLATRDLAIIYTCPAGHRAIVKRVTIFNGNAASSNCAVWLQQSTPPVQSYLHNAPIASVTAVDHERWDVLHENDELVISVDQADVQFWVSGTELAL
jgi:hypothetical protein